MDIYDETLTYQGKLDGTAIWNVEFLALAWYVTLNNRYLRPASLVYESAAAQRDIRGDSWFQFTQELLLY